MWSNDLLPIIFTRVKAIGTGKLKTKFPEINFTTSTKERTNPKFPTVVVRLLQGSERGTTFEKTVNAVNAILQIDVIDNQSQDNANTVADITSDIVRDMGFTMTGTPYIDESDPGTYRNVARYNRIIAHGDKI